MPAPALVFHATERYRDPSRDRGTKGPAPIVAVPLAYRLASSPGRHGYLFQPSSAVLPPERAQCRCHFLNVH